MSLRVHGKKRFRLDKQLGAGAFGEIYSGVDITNGVAVAVKLEPVTAEYPQLAYEARVYTKLGNRRGIPRMYYVGTEGAYNVLVMQQLGQNLETLFNACGRRFSLQTVLRVADKLLTLVERIHAEGFLHRDIKPDNFVVGTPGNEGELYVIDFGLSKCYVNPETNQHIPFRDDKHLTGTARYASINNHRGFEQSRRDDLESVGYVLIYFLKGSLPWQNLKKTETEQSRYRQMMEVKIAATATAASSPGDAGTAEPGEPAEPAAAACTLVEDLPPAFGAYLRQVMALRFDETPNYKLLRRHFKQLYAESRFEPPEGGSAAFDWQRKRRGGGGDASPPPPTPPLKK